MNLKSLNHGRSELEGTKKRSSNWASAKSGTLATSSLRSFLYIVLVEHIQAHSFMFSLFLYGCSPTARAGVTEMIRTTCPQSLKAWLSDPLQSRFVDPNLIHLGFAPQETKAQRRTKTWRDTVPSLDHKLPDYSHAVVHLASWLGRKGIIETPGRAHATRVLKTRAEVLLTSK